MTQTANAPSPSPSAVKELQTCYHRVGPPFAAQRLWDRYMGDDARTHLGGEFITAYRRLGTVGIWATVHGITHERALIEVGRLLGAIRSQDEPWLLREIGESPDANEARERTIERGDLVMLDWFDSEAHWNGHQIDVDWTRHEVSWTFFIEFARHAKAGRPLDHHCFGANADPNIVTKRKSRLIQLESFPIDLADLMVPVGRGTQKLDLAPERIRIFEYDPGEILREWVPRISSRPILSSR